MRLYEVQPGDSPASIAAQDSMAGCPKCSIDLIAVNDKPTRTLPNGYRTFLELHVGEKLVLPEKWFTPEFDQLPPSYFAALPHPDGVTPSKPPSTGVLGDQAALSVAAAKVGVLSALSGQPFSDAVNDTANAIDVSVREVDEGIGPAALAAGPYAQAARTNANQARQRNVALVTAIGSNDQTGAFQARHDILQDFSNALSSAKLALQTLGAQPSTPTGSDVAAAAKSAAAAIAADASYCTSISQPGSAVNSAVHAFKAAWNTANPSASVPIGTGTYEQATADALARTLGTAPAACAARAAPTPFDPGALTPPQEESGLSTSAVIGLGLLGAGAVGGVLYLVTREPPVRVRRVRPRPRPEPSPGWRRHEPDPGWRRHDVWKKDFS